MTWKGKYRCAVTISVDFDAETLWSGTFKLTTPSPLSRGDYDIRAGIPRILALMRKHEIPATFMVPGATVADVLDAPNDEANIAKVRASVTDMCKKFPVYAARTPQ